MKENVYLSIIVPCYNGEKTIEKAIASILCQNRQDIEMIIVNDGSTDGTEAVCRKYESTGVVRCCSTENRGAGHARNYGIAKARGTWISFLDADDLYREGSLDQLLPALHRYEAEGYEVVYTAKMRADMDLRHVRFRPAEEPHEICHIPKLEFVCCVYRKDFLDGKHIRFFEYREQDIESAFRYRVFSNSPRVVTDNDLCYYIHRDNPVSNTHTWREDVLHRVKAAIYLELLEKNPKKDEDLWLLQTVLQETKKFYKGCVKRGCSDPQGLKQVNAVYRRAMRLGSGIAEPQMLESLASSRRLRIKANTLGRCMPLVRRLRKSRFVCALKMFRRDPALFTKTFAESLRKGKHHDDPDLGGNVRLYYWRKKDNAENLGDYLSWVVTSHFREKLCPGGTAGGGQLRTLYAIGSVLGFRCQDAVVWGSGLLNPGRVYRYRLFLSKLDIRSVRGPKTREELLRIGKACPAVYGDPAVLMPQIYQPQDTGKRYDTALILHYLEETPAEAAQLHRIEILTRDYKGFIDQIVRSSRVISSSLHGVILAESYGVPAVLLLPEGKDSFKYLDWYYSTGRTDVTFARTLSEALEMEPMPLPDLRDMQEKVRAAFPTDLWK